MILSSEEYQLAERVGEALLHTKKRLVVAESCTGGMLGSWLTAVPGSSTWFLGGVISYDNSVKEGLLQVPLALMVEHGSVSAECALAMSQGVLSLLNADIAISVTGVAGPGGGTDAKPVGLAYIALVGPNYEKVEQHIWHDDRHENREQSARRALEMILEYTETL
ncbi:MAG: CinA family protein [Chloroflexia bacterium]